MTDERTKQRLIKILNLAKRGVGGEKENAQRMLDALLKKHGMTINELLDEDIKSIVWFRYKNKTEKILFAHCCLKVIDGWDRSRWSSKVRKNQYGVQVTKAQEIELGLMFAAHRKAFSKELDKQVDRILAAYVHSNNLFSNTPSEEAESGTSEISMDELEAIIALARTMKPTPVHKAIEAAA